MLTPRITKTLQTRSLCTFLQVIPVKMKHGANTTVVNTLLDSGSYTTLITSDLAKALKLKGKQRTLNIIDATSSLFSVKSKLVEFTISSIHYPEQIEVKNAWVVVALNLPSQSVSKAEIQQRWSHLRDVPTDTIDKYVSILIGANLPHL